MGLQTVQVADKPTSDRIESKVDVISTNIGNTPLPALISQGNKTISNNIANSSSYSIQIPYTSNIALGDLIRYDENTDTAYASTYMSNTGIVSNITKQPANGQATKYLTIVRNPYCNGIYFGICTDMSTKEIFVDMINVNMSTFKTYNLGVLCPAPSNLTSYSYDIKAVKCLFSIENTMALFVRYEDYNNNYKGYGSLTLLDVSSPNDLIVHCTYSYSSISTTSIVPFSNKGFIIGGAYLSVSNDLKTITRSGSIGFSCGYLTVHGTIYPNKKYYRCAVNSGGSSDYINSYYSIIFDDNCVPTETKFENNSAAVAEYKQWGFLSSSNSDAGNGYFIDSEWSIYNEVYKDNSSSTSIDYSANRMVLARSTPSGEFIKIPLINFTSNLISFHVKYAFRVDDSLYVCYGMSTNEKVTKRFDIDYTKNTATENTTISDDMAKYFNSADFVMDHYMGSDYIFASTLNTAANTYNHVVQCFNYNDLDPILGVCNNIDNENKICSVALNGVCNINISKPVGTVLPDVGTYVTKNKINLNLILKENQSAIKSIQHISSVMPDINTLDYNVTINTVDVSKSLLILRTSAVYKSRSSSVNDLFTPQISFKSSNQVRILIESFATKVYDATNRVTTEFSVVEFI